MAKNKDYIAVTESYTSKHIVREITITPLMEITDICIRISEFQHSFQNLNTERERAIEVTSEIDMLYQKILGLITLVEVKDYGILMSVLKILQYTSFPAVLSDKVYDYRIGNTNLGRAISSISAELELESKLLEYEQKIYDIAHQKELEKLTKLGLRRMQKYFHNWHFENIFDNRTWKWRKRENHENVREPWNENYEAYLQNN